MTVRPPHLIAIALAVTASAASFAFADDLPPIRRLRVPSAEVVRLFGADTAVRSLRVDDLDQRIEAAQTALAHRPPPPPRLIRAEHKARWMEGDVLEGRSTLTVDIGAQAPAAVALTPWGLPILPNSTSADLRTRPDGHLIAWITRPGISEIVIPWRLPVQPAHESAELTLDLPDSPLSSLTLDLPAGLLVDVTAPVRVRRLAADPGRTTIRIDGVSGRTIAALRRENRSTPDPGNPWLSASHRFEISAAGPRFDAEWNLHLPASPPRFLDTLWEPGLEPTAVLGPEIEGFEVVPSQAPDTHIRIRLAEGAAPRQTLRLEGLVRVPTSGLWRLPRVRLLNATLLGERTLVHLGADWTLLGTRTIASERVEVPSELLASGGTWLGFDATTDGPAAELELGARTTEPRVDLRASLRIDSDRAHLEAEAAWTFQGPRPPTLSIALPTEWTWDLVQIVSLDEPTLWSTSFETGVGHVATLIPPQSRDPSAPVIVRFHASRSLMSTTRLTVPRPLMRPGHPGDELWSLAAEERLTIRPLTNGGVEWLDPLGSPTDGFDERPRFAWRWLDDRAGLEFDLTPLRAQTAALGQLIVQPDHDALQLDAYLTIERNDPTHDRLEIVQPEGLNWTWSLIGDGVEQPLPLLAVRTLPPTNSNAPPRLVQTLKLPRLPAETKSVQLHAQTQLDPDGGPLPTFGLAADPSPEQHILIAAREDSGLELLGTGLIRLDPRVEFTAALQALPNLDSTTLDARTNRLAYRLIAGEPGPRLRVTRREQRSAPGFVRLAEWSRITGPDSWTACRLSAEFVAASVPDLKIRLPRGSLLQAAALDSTPIVPIESDGWLAIPPGSAPSRATHLLVLEYREPPGIEPWADRFPQISLPRLNTILLVDPSSSLAIPGAIDVAATPPSPPPGSSAPQPENSHKAPPAGISLRAWLETKAREGLAWIVDSEALAASGIRPATPFPDPTPRSLPEALAALGLTVRPAGSARVLTTPTAPVDPDWPARAAEAARDGRDRSGRFVTAWTWSDTPPTTSPRRSLKRLLIPDVAESRGQPRSQNGWPLEAWLTAAVLLGIGWPNPRQPERPATRLATAFTALALIALIRPDLDPWIAPLAVAGGLLATARVLPRGQVTDATSSDLAPSTITHRGTGAILLAASLHALATTVSDAAAHQPDNAPAPILILLPFDRAEDAAAPTTRAVVRLADLERLERLTRQANERTDRQLAERVDGFGARSARHRVRQADGRLLLESIYTVVGADDAGQDWPVPLEGWLGVTAWVNGTEAPITLDAATRHGTIRLRGAGPHEVRVEATGAPNGSGPIRRIVPVALALLEPTNQSSGSASEPIGPRDILETPQAPDVPTPRPLVDLLTSWEATPLGDLLEIRIRNGGPEPLRSAALRLPAPDAQIQLTRIGDRRDRLRPPDDREPGVFHVDFVPALGSGEAASVLAWLPATREPSRPRDLPRPLLAQGGETRTNQVAVRPRDGWSLQPVDPLARGGSRIPVSDFIAAWGEPVPADRRPTAAWNALEPAPLSLIVRPNSPPTRLRPRIACVIDGLRVQVRIDAEILGASPSLPSIALSLPRRLRLVNVLGEDVTGWHRSLDGDRIVITWESKAGPPKQLSLFGWLDSENSAGAIEELSREVALPIPRWHADLVEPTELTLAATPEVTLDVEEAPGWSRSVPTTGSAGPVPVRAAFRIEPGAADARLRYRLEGPAADVRVLSHLEFQPESIEWRASARYRFRGGPCRDLRLDLPSSFANNLDIRVEPPAGDVRLLPMGETSRIEIRYETPTWDEPRVVVRSLLPARPGVVDFPTLVPLGLGRVETHLAWFDASGRGFAAEGSAGVREVERARFPSRELGLEDRETRRVYRILRSGWSVRLRPARDASDRANNRILRAEVQAQVGADGSITGRLLCVLESPARHALAIRLPDSAQILGAHDGVRFLPCYRESTGPLLIPPGSGRAVALYWSTPPRASPLACDLPVPDQPGIPLHIQLQDPTSTRPVRVDSGNLVPVERPALLVETIELDARWIEAQLATLDRSDPQALRDLARSIRDLDRLRGELAVAAVLGPAPLSTRLALADAAHARLQTALRDSGVTLPVSDDGPEAEPTPQPPRLSGFGASSWFRGTTTTDPPTLVVDPPRDTPQPSRLGPTRRSAIASALVALAIWGSGRRRSPARLAVVAASLAAAAATWWLA